MFNRSNSLAQSIAPATRRTVTISMVAQATASAPPSSEFDYSLLQASTAPAAKAIQLKMEKGQSILPFHWALNQVVEGKEGQPEELVHHPSAPSAHQLYSLICERKDPTKDFALKLLRAASAQNDGRLLSLVEGILQTFKTDVEVVNQVAETLLACGHYAKAKDVVTQYLLRDQDISPSLWEGLIQVFVESQESHSELLWRLFNADCESWKNCKLDASTACSLMQVRSSVSQSALPFTALAIIRFYIRTSQQQGIPLKPLVFLVFFNIIASMKYNGAYTIHWEVTWSLFQQLNKSNPRWILDNPIEESATLCRLVMQIIAKGANPWLTYNLAKVVSARGITHGVEAALLVLHHVSLTQYREEAQAVAKEVWSWLINDVKIHASETFSRHVLPTARVLIRFGMQKALAELHSTILDNVGDFSLDFGKQFLKILEDLVCPCCSTILDETDPFQPRTCRNCLHIVPAKKRQLQPSFELAESAIMEKARRRKRKLKEDWSKLKLKVAEERNAGAWAPSTMRPLGEAADGIVPLTSTGSQSPVILSPVLTSTISMSAPLPNQVGALLRDAAEVFKSRILQPGSLVPGVAVSHSTSSGRSLQLDLPPELLGVEDVRKLEPVKLQTPPSVSRGEGNAVAARARSKIPATPLPDNVPWRCVWCQQENPVNQSRSTCSACQAETGPAASWRTFAYFGPDDIISEILERIKHAREEPKDAVTAAYYLMVYRRSFLLKALPSDFDAMDDLVGVLIGNDEKILAAYVYFRLIPPKYRKLNQTVRYLARLFGQEEVSYVLRESDLKNTESLFRSICGPSTCGLCFGQHHERVCPIVTRQFDAATGQQVSMSDEQRELSRLDRLKKLIDGAKQENRPSVMEAYKGFIMSPLRELFAQKYSVESNTLAQLLARVGHPQRAAFVTCHIPLEKRKKETYLSFCSYFGVAPEDVEEVVSRSQKPLTTTQVTLTCCMCLDSNQHASFNCPRMLHWFDRMVQFAKSEAIDGSHYTELEQLINQSDGWLCSGPERLYSLYRFLLERVGEIDQIQRRNEAATVIIQLLNRCVIRLCRNNNRSYALRLFSRISPLLVHKEALVAMLELNNVPSELIAAAKTASSTTDEWRALAMPSTSCLICFDDQHTFHDCPEMQALKHLHVQRIIFVANQISSISDPERGIAAAADYLYYLYLCGFLGTTLISKSPILAKCILKIILMCFAHGMTLRGQRLMARIPVLILEDSVHISFWRSARLDENQAVERVKRLTTLRTQYNIPSPAAVISGSAVPLADGEEKGDLSSTPSTAGTASVDTSNPATPPPGGSNVIAPRGASIPLAARNSDYIRQYHSVVEQSLCRHCWSSKHTITECELAAAEMGFGRDIIAVFRVTVSSTAVPLQLVRTTIFRMAKFIVQHHQHLPYHIIHVARSVNSVAAWMAMISQPGVALRVLLCLPPSYRMRHVFHHLLHALGLPRPECVERVKKFKVVAESPSDEQGSSSTMDHLINHFSPIPDHVFAELLHDIPSAMQQLREADERILRVVEGKETKGNAEALLDGSNENLRKIQVEQHCTIETIRAAFNDIQTDMEKVVKIRLGSRHQIFTEDITIEPSGEPTPASSSADAN